MIVQLKHGSLPPPLGVIADHFWFTVSDPRSGHCDRWEVWQRRDAGGVSFGHLHRNLQGPDDGVGGGPSRVAAEWTGTDAHRLGSILALAATEYPYCDRYRAWPGPNSNTFVAWVLRQGGVVCALSWKAHGRNFEG